MIRRLAPLGFALLAAPVLVQAQGPAIDHQPIGCIVAGQFPKLNACFNPATDVARGRVYFKATEPKASPHVYWVEFKPDAPCFSAILPKPTKAITQMMYYVEVSDKKFQESRTGDRLVKIVADKGGCDKDVPVAGWVQNASVVVGAPAGAPAIPIGFASTSVVGAGGGGLLVPLVIGGGAAAATTIVVASSSGDDSNSPTPTPGPGPTVAAPTPTPVIPTASTPTPTPPPTGTPFRPSCRVTPTSGVEPLLVDFNCCASTGSNLRFEYDFQSDGIVDVTNTCRTSRIYRLSGPAFAPLVTDPPSARFSATVVVLADGGSRDENRYGITVTGPPGLTVEAARPVDRRVSLQVDLDGSDSAQVVLNGSAGVYARRGRSTVAAGGRRGTNRVELQLVQAGDPGKVTVDLRSMPSLVPGSLRVVAGDLVSISDTTITFRLKGRSGERVVFTMEAAD